MICKACAHLADVDRKYNEKHDTNWHTEHESWCEQPITCTCQHRKPKRGSAHE